MKDGAAQDSRSAQKEEAPCAQIAKPCERIPVCDFSLCPLLVAQYTEHMPSKSGMST
jgi:hypothetical protein